MGKAFLAIGAHGQNGETLILVLFLKLVQINHFFFAGRTPRGPKVDQNRTFFEIIIEHNRFAIELFQFDVGYSILRNNNGHGESQDANHNSIFHIFSFYYLEQFAQETV